MTPAASSELSLSRNAVMAPAKTLEPKNNLDEPYVEGVLSDQSARAGSGSGSGAVSGRQIACNECSVWIRVAVFAVTGVSPGITGDTDIAIGVQQRLSRRFSMTEELTILLFYCFTRS